jgi:hypothetical protein
MARKKNGERPVAMATLVRGRVYFLGGRAFERGKALPVPAAERAHLEANATDGQMVHDMELGRQHRTVCKFEFHPLPDGDPDPPAAA